MTRLTVCLPIILLTASTCFHLSQAQTENLVHNGDFSAGLAHWSPGILNAGSIPGYPRWGTYVYPTRGNPSAFLDVPGGAFAYLDSDFFFMPNAGTLKVTLWGNHDPVVLGVQVKIEGGPVYVLDSLEPPRTEMGQTPVTKQYLLGDNVAGRSIAVRFVCRSEPSFLVGTLCNYDDVFVSSQGGTVTSTSTALQYPVLRGQYVSVDWSKFREHPEVAVWAQRTADAQYRFLAGAQGLPPQHMRQSLIHLDSGRGGWASHGEVGVGVDWFFGRNLIAPPEQGPSAGMSPQDYSLQRLDAELYHEIAHNIPVVVTEGYRPQWFTEALGTWVQSSVTAPGAYTGIRAQMEDVFWYDDAYLHPDAFAGYGKGALFLWWLIDNHGIDGLHVMVSQCYGWERAWSSEEDIDLRGFIPWTGRSKNQLAQEYESSIQSGWRANIASLVNRYAIPELGKDPVLPIVLALLIILLTTSRGKRRLTSTPSRPTVNHSESVLRP